MHAWPVLLALAAGLSIAPVHAGGRYDYESHHRDYPPARQELPRDRLKPSWPFHRDSNRRHYGRPQPIQPHGHYRLRHHQQPPYQRHDQHRHGLGDRIRLEQDGRQLRAYDEHGRNIGRQYLRHDERWERRHGRIYIRGPYKIVVFDRELDRQGHLYLRPRAQLRFQDRRIAVSYDRMTEYYSLDLRLQSRDYH